MPKKKAFETTIHVKLPKELADFLQQMVQSGEAESISQAARKAIQKAKASWHGR
jgi:Arc/MetJ-type ribon-helix-helix transcriptional regulator